MFLLKKKKKKIVLSSNEDKRMQSIDSIETYVYGTTKDLVSVKREIKYTNTIKQHKKRLPLINGPGEYIKRI